MKLSLYVISAIFLVAAISCSNGSNDKIVLSGTITADATHAGSRVGGRINEVMVKEGDTVQSGETLFTLETNVLQAERNRLEALLNEAQTAYNVIASGAKPEDIASVRQQAESLRQAYELTQAGPLPEEIAAAENQAEALHAAYQNAQDAADRMSRLYDEGAVSQRDYVASTQAAEAARNQWEASQQQVEALKARPRDQEVAGARARYLAALDTVASLEAGATPQQLASAQARIGTAREAIDRLNVDMSETSVVAPETGILDTFNLEPGDFIAPGQQTCRIVNMADLKVVVYVPENRLGYISEGMEVPVHVDSFPGQTFTGTVDSVAAEAEFTPRNVQTVDERVSQVFAVTIRVPNPEGRLRPGMAADVTIDLKAVRN